MRCVPTLGMGLTYPLVGPEATPHGVGGCRPASYGGYVGGLAVPRLTSPIGGTSGVIGGAVSLTGVCLSMSLLPYLIIYLRCPTCGVVYTLSTAYDRAGWYAGEETPIPPTEAVALVLAGLCTAGTCNACYKATEAGSDFLPRHA